MRDPIELYEYPKEWWRKGAEKKVASGLYILTKDGWLRRGITTGTTASASLAAAIASKYEEIDFVSVETPIGLKINVPVFAKDGVGVARKFSGDHEFDATNSTIFISKLTKDKKILFSRGIAFESDFVVSRSAMDQLKRNFEIYSEKYGYEGGIIIDAYYRKTSEKLNGVAILGTTGFVEPWCDELLKTKIEIAQQYRKIAITTGRETWKFAKENFPDYQPFVFGVHIREALRAHEGEIIIVGKPGLLRKMFGSSEREEIMKKLKNFANVVEVVVCST